MIRPFKLHARRYPGAAPHVPFLAPWSGLPAEDAASLHAGQFATWASRPPANYLLVDRPEDADVHVLSIAWKETRTDDAARSFANQEIATAGTLGRPIVIFFDSDHDEAIAWPAHAIVFRFSIYAETRHPGEFAIPTFSQDFLAQHYGDVPRLRTKHATPSVSFCGYAPPLGCAFSQPMLRETARYVAYRLKLLQRRRRWVAHAPRVQALRTLRATPGIDSRFLIRDRFAFNQWGVLQPGGTADTATQQRTEFVTNLDGADYALCTRGLANCSIRFYEALSLGRLPLFINTACVLPFDWIVNWREVGLWVEEHDLPHLGERLLAHHAQLSPAEFSAQQRRARELFAQWILPENFFAELHRHFPRARERFQS